MYIPKAEDGKILFHKPLQVYCVIEKLLLKVMSKKRRIIFRPKKVGILSTVWANPILPLKWLLSSPLSLDAYILRYCYHRSKNLVGFLYLRLTRANRDNMPTRLLSAQFFVTQLFFTAFAL